MMTNFLKWLKKLLTPKQVFVVKVSHHALRRFKMRFHDIEPSKIVKAKSYRNYVSLHVRKLLEDDKLVKINSYYDRYQYEDEVWVLVFHEKYDHTLVEVVTCWKDQVWDDVR